MSEKKKSSGCLSALIIAFIIMVILAVLGWVSYVGFTVGANRHAAKNIYAEIVKYSEDEIKKCNIGNDTFMDTLKCPAEPKKIIKKLLETYSETINPFTFNENTLTGKYILKNNIDISKDSNIGFININFTDQNIVFEQCHDKPCKDSLNQSISSLKIR
jgi:Tfp pilus assembly protein PilE